MGVTQATDCSNTVRPVNGPPLLNMKHRIRKTRLRRPYDRMRSRLRGKSIIVILTIAVICGTAIVVALGNLHDRLELISAAVAGLLVGLVFAFLNERDRLRRNRFLHELLVAFAPRVFKELAVKVRELTGGTKDLRMAWTPAGFDQLAREIGHNSSLRWLEDDQRMVAEMTHHAISNYMHAFELRAAPLLDFLVLHGHSEVLEIVLIQRDYLGGWGEFSDFVGSTANREERTRMMNSAQHITGYHAQIIRAIDRRSR